MALLNSSFSRGAKASLPLTEHSLFPTCVALWFAALFSLSTLAVRGAILEQAVLNSHLDALITPLSPPLGVFSRLILAAIMGGIGAVIGHFAARWVVAGNARAGESISSVSKSAFSQVGVFSEAGRDMLERFRVRPRDSHPDAPARRPIRVHEELGFSFSGSDLAALPATGEAALPLPHGAIEHDAEPSPAGIADGPLAPVTWAPANDVQASDVRFDVSHSVPAAGQPFDAAPQAQPLATLHPAAFAPALDAAEPAYAIPGEAVAVEDHYGEPVAVGTGHHPRLAPAPLAPPIGSPSAADRIAAAPLEDLSHLELIARLAIAMQNRRTRVGMAGSPAAAKPDDGLAPAEPDGTTAMLGEALASLRALG